MKRIVFKYIIALLPLLSLALSCSDVKDMDEWDPGLVSDGPPSIRKITTSSDTTTIISIASLNQSIAIFGDNLSGVESVKINDIEVDINDIYQTRRRLEIVVPRILPVEIDNKLKIITQKGSVTADLKITLPQLYIQGFYNDFAADGDSAIILGSDFDLYQIDPENAVLKLNGQPIQMVEYNDKSFSIFIPNGTPTNQASVLTIETPVLKEPVQIPFRETGISILTNDDRTWSGAWWAKDIWGAGPDADPAAPLFLWYVHVKASYGGSWQWDNIHMNWFWLDESARDVINNPGKYYIKFEILNPPGTPLANQIRLGQGGGYEWNPASSNNGVSLNTMGKWKTVALEVTDLYPPGNNNEKTCLFIANDPYNNWDQRNVLQVASNRELPGDVEFYYWNFRIVKKINAD